MAKADLKLLVEEGFRIDQEIKAAEKALELKQDRLEQIKKELKGHANGVAMDLPGDGCVAEITFPPSTPRQLDPKLEAKAKKIAGPQFKNLFVLAPVKGFTDVARATLGDSAEKLIELVAGKGNGRISFVKV